MWPLPRQPAARYVGILYADSVDSEGSLPDRTGRIRTGRIDYGWDFFHKQASLYLFRRYWASPSCGLPEVPGIFTRTTLGDAGLSLLDGRRYRDHTRLGEAEQRCMFGEAQMRWLKNQLLRSRARFKFIASVSQFINGEINRSEDWHNHPTELAAFLDWLQRSGATGVVFLSGGRHPTQLMRMLTKKRVLAS